MTAAHIAAQARGGAAGHLVGHLGGQGVAQPVDVAGQGDELGLGRRPLGVRAPSQGVREERVAFGQPPLR